MNLQKFFLAALFCVLSLMVCFGQNTPETVEGENWVNQYGIYYPTPTMVFRYDRYSREDTVKFREKLDLLKDVKFSDEWNGIYYVGSEETVNHSELRINSNIGFIEFNVYTCLPELRYINYGKIMPTAEFIQLSPEFTENSPRKSEPVKYVKVKWGIKYLLVEESALRFFAEKAVGVYVKPEDDLSEDSWKWKNFWVKADSNSENHHQVENEYVGLPQFPESYKNFQRSPIDAKIISVGNRTIQKADVVGNENSDFMEASYKVTISAGKAKGVKTGMTFNVLETGEEFVIKQVNQNSAVGEIVRSLDEYKNDFCVDDKPNRITCPKIKPSMKAKTRIGYFWL